MGIADDEAGAAEAAGGDGGEEGAPVDFGLSEGGGDALDISFGHGQHEGLLAGDAFLLGRRVEMDAPAHLRDAQLDRSHAGVEELGFEVIGRAGTFFATLIRLGLEHGGALLGHSLIEE